MRILWITNTIFPVLRNILSILESMGGGWMFCMAKELVHDEK